MNVLRMLALLALPMIGMAATASGGGSLSNRWTFGDGNNSGFSPLDFNGSHTYAAPVHGLRVPAPAGLLPMVRRRRV